MWYAEHSGEIDAFLKTARCCYGFAANIPTVSELFHKKYFSTALRHHGHQFQLPRCVYRFSSVPL